MENIMRSGSKALLDKEAAADARARAGNPAAADAEHTAPQALTITATTAQAREGGAIAPATGDIEREPKGMNRLRLHE